MSVRSLLNLGAPPQVILKHGQHDQSSHGNWARGIRSSDDAPTPRTYRNEDFLNNFTEVDASEFYAGFAQARQGKYGAFLSDFSEEDFAADNVRTFIAFDGQAGGALTDHGDGRIEVGSLFSLPDAPRGAGLDVLDHLIHVEGANWLNNFDGPLTSFYQDAGFEVETRDSWNEEYAPPDWNYDLFGTPDYVTMGRNRVEKSDGTKTTNTRRGDQGESRGLGRDAREARRRLLGEARPIPGRPVGVPGGVRLDRRGRVTKHGGPGAHVGTGTPQTVHGTGGGGTPKRLNRVKGFNKPFNPSGPPALVERINEIEQLSMPLMSEPGVRRGGDTMGLYGEWEGDTFIGWTPERLEWQNDVLAAHEQFQIELNGQEPKYEKKVLIMSGLPGSGKTFTLAHFAPVDLADYVVVNADDLKESIIFDDDPPPLGEFKGMELSSVVHEESSHMAKRWEAMLQERGANMVLDITGGNRDSTLRRINKLKEAGYTVDVAHIDVNPEEAWHSTIKRYESGMETETGGRPVPPSYIKAMAVDAGHDIIDDHYESYRDEVNGHAWHYRNYPITKQPPELIESK